GIAEETRQEEIGAAPGGRWTSRPVLGAGEEEQAGPLPLRGEEESFLRNEDRSGLDDNLE
ncbi:unnamed protein product, partial [Amoebophrya sp. A25]